MAEDLAHRAAISDVLDDYARGIDTRDFDLVASLFTPEAHLDYTSSCGPAASRDEVVEWLRASLPAIAMTQHLLTNRRIRIDGDTAIVRTELLNPLLFEGEAGTELLLLGGRYDDQFVRVDDRWLISHRVHVTTWTAGPLPAQLTGQE